MPLTMRIDNNDKSNLKQLLPYSAARNPQDVTVCIQKLIQSSEWILVSVHRKERDDVSTVSKKSKKIIWHVFF